MKTIISFYLYSLKYCFSDAAVMFVICDITQVVYEMQTV